MQKLHLFLILFVLTGYFYSGFAQILEVGEGYTYTSLSAAIQEVNPGDTIRVHQGVYEGGLYFYGVQGDSSAPILITAAKGDTVIFRGGNTAIQFSDPAWLNLHGLIFEQQTINGVNTDDGGDYNTPAHHIRIENCTFRDLNASDNNDLLKMSGVDYFEILNCMFENGSAGGSGIDMVGCHNGLIKNNRFFNMGSNSIQAKGGSQYVRIEANRFEDGGQRSLNLGGSTGLPYFRPLNAGFEAADLQVYANVFIRSVAPIAYVGCINVDVINNTIIFPENWAIRILQETVDPDRFIECGEGSFQNNIIYLGNIGTTVNIGPDTRPETFLFANNLWYNFENSEWSGPNLPTEDTTLILGADPLFSDVNLANVSLLSGSPAIGRVYDYNEPAADFNHTPYNNPRSLGAIEANPAVVRIKEKAVSAPLDYRLGQNFPNPFNPSTRIPFTLSGPGFITLTVFNNLGQKIETILNKQMQAGTYEVQFHAPDLPSGIYFYRLLIRNRPGGAGAFQQVRKMVFMR